MRDEKLAQAYQSMVDDYLSKGYIREVPEDEPKPPSEWFLPHFPVVRPEKATKKVRVVFDGSAQQNGKSLVLSCKVTLWMFKLSLEGSQLP